MKPFLYIIGGMLILGALLIVCSAPRDHMAWLIAGILALCGAYTCWLNRR